MTSYFIKSSPENVAVQKVSYAPSDYTISERIKSFQFITIAFKVCLKQLLNYKHERQMNIQFTFSLKEKTLKRDHCFDKLRLLRNIKLYVSNSYISNKKYVKHFFMILS